MKETRYLTNDELNRIRNEEDMLKGNINRMCVTDSLKELFSMYDFAMKRISTIYNINLKKFLDDNSEVDLAKKYIEDHKNETCENCRFYLKNISFCERKQDTHHASYGCIKWIKRGDSDEQHI
jgi:hypothetical protein